GPSRTILDFAFRHRRNTVILRLVVIAIAGFCLAAPAALAQEPSPESIVDLRRASDARISPDGSRVVFVTTRWSEANDAPKKPISEIWIVPASGGEPHRFTQNDKGDSSPRFSPDGQTLAFLSQRGGSDKNQIYVMSTHGGESKKLSDSKTGVDAFSW